MPGYPSLVDAGVFYIIIGVIVAVLSIVIVISVYHVGYASIGGLGVLAGSVSQVGYTTLSIVLTASGGRVIVNNIIVYSGSGVLLDFATGYEACSVSLEIYNSTGAYTTWGRQVLKAGESVTINIHDAQALRSQPGQDCLMYARYIQVFYNYGRSIVLINTG